MAIVTQLSPIDPALVPLPNSTGFLEYLYQNVNYVLDTVAQVVYMNIGGGVLAATNSSYSQFQTFLAANTITQANNPAAAGGPITNPSSGVSITPFGNAVPTLPVVTTEQQVIAYLRQIHLALMVLATSGGQSTDADFDPGIGMDFSAAPPRMALVE